MSEDRERKALAKAAGDPTEPIWRGVIDTEVEVEFAHPVDLVWQELTNPEFSLVESEVFSGRVEGTPEGVGEIRVSIHEAGGRRHVHTIEITEWEMCRRIAARELPNHDAGVLSKTYAYDFEPRGDRSCAVRYRAATEVRARESVAERLRTGLGRQVETGLLGLSATLDHGAESIEAPPNRGTELCLEVEEVFTVTGRGTAVIGVIQSGTVSIGDQLWNETRNELRPATVVEIDTAPRTSRTVTDARPRIGFLIAGWTQQELRLGDVLTNVAG